MSADQFQNSQAAGSDDRPAADAFAPPSDFDFGHEFAAPPPRPLPDFVPHSRYILARKATVWALLMVGAMCWATEWIPFVQTLSWYLLPLGYLNWIAWGMFALAALYWLRNVTTLGHAELLRTGLPLVGRVRQVEIKFSGSGEVRTGRYAADVEFRDPTSGDLQLQTVLSPEPLALWQLAKIDPGVTAGDYVTLVFLPGRLEKSLQLYGWLGLNPRVDLMRKNGRPLTPQSPLTSLMVVICVTAVLWALLAFLYVIGRYDTFDDDFWSPYAVGIGLATIPFAIMQIRRFKRAGATAYTLLKRVVVAAFLSLLGGFMVGFTTVGFLNGFFDGSPLQLEPIKIVQLWEETHELIIRNYQLEYHTYPAGDRHKKMVSIETLMAFHPDSLGVVDIGSGWLGMRWLRDFYPIEWQYRDEDQNKPLPGEIRFRMPDDPQPHRLVPLVVIGTNLPLSPPKALLPELQARMALQVTNHFKATVIEPADKR
jgi:hypothetical protein